jgi:RimJ/RimL family protein N-acetyltransferase
MDLSSRNLEWPVTTDRLSIRPATAEDAAAVWHYRQLESVAQWMTSAPVDLPEFSQSFSEPERLALTLLIEHDGVIIGDLMLRAQDAWSQTEVKDQAHNIEAELGWCLDPAYEGLGFATEAVTALIRICFVELGLRRVIANCFAQNEPSWRLMERVRMRREQHEIRGSLHRSGDWLDGFSYALLKDEWLALNG